MQSNSSRSSKAALISLLLIITLMPTRLTLAGTADSLSHEFNHNLLQLRNPAPSLWHHQAQSPHVSGEKSGKYRRAFLFTQLYHDFSFFVRRPGFCAVVGGVALAPSFLGNYFRSEDAEFTEMWGNSQFADDFFELGEGYGQSAYTMSAAGALYLLGRTKSDAKLRSFGSDLFRAHLINGVFTLGMKGLVNRARPNGASYSYPSGHTSSAFTTAGVIYSHYGKLYSLPAFALATYVGFSRLQENKHYFSDVVAGAVLGSYIGINIVRDPEDAEGIKVSPTLYHGAPGVKLTLKF
jgi:membrane-associated phospholipid phosphatase